MRGKETETPAHLQTIISIIFKEEFKMAQTFSTEAVKAIRPVLVDFSDDLYKSLRKGVNEALECAKDANAPKLIKTCEASVEGTETLIKAFTELVDELEQYCKYIEGIAAKIGQEV